MFWQWAVHCAFFGLSRCIQKMFRISLQIVINPCRPRPNMALDARVLHLSSSKKTFDKKGNLPPNFRTPRLKQEYWVLSIFFAAAVPSCIIIASHSVWTRCPDWNHGQGGNMRSPLKPPSYNPCHPWDDFMRSRETCMCLCWAESGGCERSEVRSPTTPSRVCTMSRLYCFACVPNAESTNDTAHMQQSFFCPQKRL